MKKGNRTSRGDRNRLFLTNAFIGFRLSEKHDSAIRAINMVLHINTINKNISYSSIAELALCSGIYTLTPN